MEKFSAPELEIISVKNDVIATSSCNDDEFWTCGGDGTQCVTKYM